MLPAGRELLGVRQSGQVTWWGVGLLGLLGLILLIGFSGHARARTALDHLLFQTQPVEGLLKSDPALLYYFTERILEAGGGTPDDWRADPRVQFLSSRHWRNLAKGAI